MIAKATPSPDWMIQLYTWASLLVVIVASCLMLRQELSYNQTYDESVHLAAGMEWLSAGTYHYDELAPPLARLAIALPLRLSGGHTIGLKVESEEGTLELNEHDAYRHNLLLARLGVIPFFWISNLLLFLWMRRLRDTLCAFFAVFLFSFSPFALAHSALATLDAPFAATFLLAVLTLERVLESPTLRLGVLTGLTCALAVSTKYTGLPFYTATLLLMLLWQLRLGRSLRPLLRPTLGALPAFALTIWSVFRFSFGPLYSAAMLNSESHSTLATVHGTAARLLQAELPAPGFFRGVLYAFRIGGLRPEVHQSFLLGVPYHGGRWYFFPVALLVKTPLPLLLLAAIGTWWAATRLSRSSALSTLLGGIAGPLAVGMLANINLGLRHVLPAYPFIVLLGALGAGALVEGSFLSTEHVLPGEPLHRLHGAGAVVWVLLAWEMVGCIVASPNFLSYFNVAAMPFYGRILVESDLDWGQDFYYLEDRLQNVDPHTVSVAYFGDPAIRRHVSTGWHDLGETERASSEWLAVSETLYRQHPDRFGYLNGRDFERVGRTIRLYHLHP